MSTTEQAPAASSSPSPSTSTSSSSLTPDSLTRLDSQLFLYRSSASSLPKSKSPPLTTLSALTKASAPPRVVLLLGWMDAPLRLVSKYAEPYTRLFPHASILIQLSNGQTYLQGRKAPSLRVLSEVLLQEAEKEHSRNEMRREMEDVERRGGQLTLDEDKKRDTETETTTEKNSVQMDDSTASIIDNKDKDSPPSPSLNIHPAPTGLIIHTFSDGGSSNLHYLLSYLTSTLSKRLPIRATIFDSSPSAGTPVPGATAFTMPMLKSHWWLVRVVLRGVVRLSIIVYLYFLLALRKLLRRKSRHEVFRTALNDVKSWTPSDLATSSDLPPRLYLYSEADQLVPYKAVEQHAQDAWSKIKHGDASKTQDKNKIDFVQVDGKSEQNDSNTPHTSVVRLRRWANAPHCSIARVDSDRYWKEVGDFLGDVLR